MQDLHHRATSPDNRAAWLSTGPIVEPGSPISGARLGRVFLELAEPLPAMGGKVYPIGTRFYGRRRRRRRDVRVGVYLVQLLGRTVVGCLMPAALAEATGQPQATLLTPVGPLPLYFEWGTPGFLLFEIEHVLIPVD